MSNDLSPRVTGLLLAWSEGDREALVDLMPLVCDELRQMARRSLDREASGHTLQPTALVNEFFLSIQSRRTVSWRNRAHFFGSAAQTMRLILVDHFRRQSRKKRGSGEKVVAADWELAQIPSAESNLEILEVHDALDRLEVSDPRAAAVVKLRFFVGMTVAETASALEVSVATIKREWQFARLWLYRELQAPPSAPRAETGESGVSQKSNASEERESAHQTEKTGESAESPTAGS